MTADLTSSVSVVRDERGTRIIVAGELDIATAPKLLDATQTAARDGVTGRIVVDLSPVTFIDSSGLGALLRCQRCARQAGRDFMLATPLPHRVARVLDISGVRTAFDYTNQ